MNEKVWNAGWITSKWTKDANPMAESHIAFRRDYYVEEEPTEAIISITSFYRHKLWINGVLASDGFVRSYPKEQLYFDLNVTSYLKKGKNAFAVIVEKPVGVTGYSLVSRMGLLIDGIIRTPNTEIPVLTNKSWKARSADWYVPTNHLFSVFMGPQEHYDATFEPCDWKTAEPDDTFTDAFYIGGAFTPPWKSLKKSILKGYTKTINVPELIWEGSASRKMLSITHTNPAVTFSNEEIAGNKIQPVLADFYTKSDEKNVCVFDFGKTSYLSVGLDVKEYTGAVRLEVYYNIKFDEKPFLMEGAVDTFVPSKHNLKWKSLIPRGVRFITVKVVGEGQCAFKLDAETVEYNYEHNNSFETNNAFIKRIWETSKNTLLTATTDVIGEPVRENVLWTMDACLGGEAAFFTFGDAIMWEHCLDLVAQGIDEDGVPNAVVPASYSFMVLFDQTFYWVASCLKHLTFTGDKEFAKKMLPSIERLLNLCKQHITEEGYFIPPDYAWHWVDWAKLNREPYSLPINLMLLMAAQACNKMADCLGTTIEASQQIEGLLSKNLVDFYDENEKAFRAHIPCSKKIEKNSIINTFDVDFDLHSNALAYLTGLGTKEQRRNGVLKMLHIFKKMDPSTYLESNVFSIPWTQMILEPLFSEGFSVEAFQVMNMYHKPFFDVDAVTWSEDFYPTGQNTSHGWGACINSLVVESILGIKALDTEFTKVGIHPNIPKQSDVAYTFVSPRGKIEYTCINNELKVVVPEGIEIIYS